MFWIDTGILIGSVLLLLGVVSSKFSSRFGMPGLVPFMGLGMLAGSEGIGGIEFEDYSLAFAFGTVVLSLILFSGGLGTPMSAIRDVWKPAGLLATLGVLMTSLVTGLAASWILRIPLPLGLLLGCIVGSTDASAVFSIFRAGGVHVRRQLADTIEVESGSNDPMAIFLTIGMIQYLTGSLTSGVELIRLFIDQVVVGLGIGVLIGYCAVWVIKAIKLDVAGLYPILATSFALFSYGLAADLGGSGFLSVYVTGIVIGHKRVAFHRGIEAFHDAAAWLGQIVMFVLLGLLSFPSRLWEVFWPGLAIAAVLIFCSRPLAVWLCLLRSRFSVREKVFLSWVGLKGAVPITLAIFPLTSNIEGASIIFDAVFFVVIVSAVFQGANLKWFAKRLEIDVPPKRQPPVTLEISSLHEVEGDIVDYFIENDTGVVGKAIRELALPDDVVIALIVRNKKIELPKGRFRIQAGDHVVVVLHRHVRILVDRIFSRTQQQNEKTYWPSGVEFPLSGGISVQAFKDLYGIELGNPEWTLAQWMQDKLSAEELAVGSAAEVQNLKFRVRELNLRNEIVTIGLTFMADRQPLQPDRVPQVDSEPSPKPTTSDAPTSSSDNSSDKNAGESSDPAPMPQK